MHVEFAWSFLIGRINILKLKKWKSREGNKENKKKHLKQRGITFVELTRRKSLITCVVINLLHLGFCSEIFISKRLKKDIKFCIHTCTIVWNHHNRKCRCNIVNIVETASCMLRSAKTKNWLNSRIPSLKWIIEREKECGCRWKLFVL